MFPQLHKKTHYRAAMEYSIGSGEKKLSHRLNAKRKPTEEIIDGVVLKASNILINQVPVQVSVKAKSQPRIKVNTSQQTIVPGGEKSKSTIDLSNDPQIVRLR